MKKEEVISCLTKMKPLLKEFEFLLKGMRIKRVPRGQYLVNRVSPPGGVYVLAEGLARVYEMGKREHTLWLLTEGSVFHPAVKKFECYDQFRYVECLENCVFYYFSAQDVAGHFYNPAFWGLPGLLREIESQQQLQGEIFDCMDPIERFKYFMRAESYLLKRMGFYQLCYYLHVGEQQLKTMMREYRERLKQKSEMVA